MEATRTLEESHSQYGYPMKKVIASIALAAVLHVVVLSAYFILGSSKKPPAAATAAKPAETDPKAAPSANPKDPKSPGEAASTKPAGSGDEKKSEKPSDEAKKNTDVAKPGEIPSKPDSDIDDILKRK